MREREGVRDPCPTPLSYPEINWVGEFTFPSGRNKWILVTWGTRPESSLGSFLVYIYILYLLHRIPTSTFTIAVALSRLAIGARLVGYRGVSQCRAKRLIREEENKSNAS